MTTRLDQAPAASAGTLSGRLDPFRRTEPGMSMPQPAHPDQTTFCACRCGDKPAHGRRFISGHNLRVQEPKSETHRQRISDGQRRAWATKRSRKPLGSRRLDANGYWLVKVREGGGRWDKEHVLAVEQSIGRRLALGEQVHHINGVRTDNRLENLQLCRDGSEHARIEATFKRLMPALLASGVVVYDRQAKEYRIA